MKVAMTSDGKQIPASNAAPQKAICPSCKGRVELRKRKKMGTVKYSYYWRHQDGENPECPEGWKLRY